MGSNVEFGTKAIVFFPVNGFEAQEVFNSANKKVMYKYFICDKFINKTSENLKY
tara:strand:+ start:483 stop:644 length:162 start_codon:yes stop_codon:yes gene_type:complete